MLSEDRVKVLDKINELESKCLWDEETEINPESPVLMPDDVDYLNKKLSSKILTKIANHCAVSFFEKQIRKGDFVIKEINGFDNYKSVKGGAVLTCNHFSIFDHYTVYRAIRKDLKHGHQLYKVIREGNYTGFKGLFGFFFKHCNTLPLSSNMQTMRKFLKAVNVLLCRGEKILVYPEQSMWWNYKKPRPLKSGAFRFASSNNVPVIPTFITMEDTNKIAKDGSLIQAYTLWFLPPIYPKKEFSEKENAEYMKDENFKAWKELYESVYKIPLAYGA